MLTSPRRQQLRGLALAVSYGAVGAGALAAAVLAGDLRLSLLLALMAATSALAGRHALRLASRSRVGAVSESQVRRALEELAREGWRVRHAVDWPGRGDIDHVVGAPSGLGFAIETKTRRWTTDHVARTIDAAYWLGHRSRRHPRGVVPVLCVARARRLELSDGDVIIVSLDRLVPSLRAAAGTPGLATLSC